MASFAELWDKSRLFRQLFLRMNVFRSVNNVDVTKAEVLWYDRWPEIEWDFCGHNGCIELVKKGEICGEHCLSVSKKMPTWKWYLGKLYRYISVRVAVAESRYVRIARRSYTLPSAREYKDYAIHMAELIAGDKVKAKFSVGYIDGNPFNLRPSNIITVSDCLLSAVDNGVITTKQALFADTVLAKAGFFPAILSRPINYWAFNMETISKVCGIERNSIKCAVSEKRLVPGDLASLVRFCHKRMKRVK